MPPPSARTRSIFCLRDGLAMIEEPAQPVERNLGVHAFEYVQEALDRFVVGRVQPERPAVGHQQPDDRFQLDFERVRQVRTRFEKVLEVGGGEHQHFARAVHAQEIVAFAGLRHLHPLREILDFLLRVLREQVVRDAHRQLVVLRHVHDDGVVIRIRLIAAARIDRARHAEAVQLAHEVPRRIALVLRRELRAFGERGVQKPGVRPRDQHAGRIAALVALDLAAGRIRACPSYSRPLAAPPRSTARCRRDAG